MAHLKRKKNNLIGHFNGACILGYLIYGHIDIECSVDCFFTVNAGLNYTQRQKISTTILSFKTFFMQTLFFQKNNKFVMFLSRLA